MKNNLLLLLPVIMLMACNEVNKNDKLSPGVSKITSPAGDSSSVPFLFSDKEGTAYLSWVEKNAKMATLKFASLQNDNWSAPVTIASGDDWFVNWADYPSLSADGEGNMIAHYLQKSDTNKFTYDIKYVTTADNGKTWSDARILHDDGKFAEHGFVSFRAYGDNYFVSWLDGRKAVMEPGHEGHEGHAGEMTVRGAILSKDGSKINDWELDGRVCDCCQTSAAITSNGPVVVYRDRSADEIRDMSVVRWVNGSWTEPKPVYHDNWKIEGCPVNGPGIDAIDNTVAITWFSMPVNKAEVKLVFSADGGETFSDPIHIDEGKPIGRVAVQLLDKTTAAVLWMEGSSIRLVKVKKDGTKEPSIVIATSSESRSAGFPQMIKSGNRLLIAWTDAGSKKVKLAFLPI